MLKKPKIPIQETIKSTIIGKAKNPLDKSVFHNLSLIAFFAWVGLGADGLSSSCYGPEQTFLALHGYPYLSLFVALITGLTVFIISESYSQIIELFPTGGGGYLVASKLLSPSLGMISGCALLIDYVLTIAISIASGTDALFSFLPFELQPYKIIFAVFGIFGLIVMNMRGVKETIIPLVPIFIIFILTHTFVVLYALITHATQFPQVIQSTAADVHVATSNIGFVGMVFLILRSYSLGAGTYTGIEAVSNGLSILREPRVKTGKRTMRYMSFSLAFTAMGLIVAYLLFEVGPQSGKTLNAVLFDNITKTWPGALGYGFILITLISEAFLLFVAAQTGFLGGPKVLANMATDRWFPSKFATLSDRLVTQNGVLLMGLAAMITMVLTQGSVHILVVLYSINVFITFCFSLWGMTKHWWNVRGKVTRWKRRICISTLGFVLASFILMSVIVLKFHDGGWITLLCTGGLVLLAVIIKRHYIKTAKLLHRLNSLVKTATDAIAEASIQEPHQSTFDPKAKTAVLLVNGFNGLGLHTLFNVVRLFGGSFKNFVFVEVGVIDAGNFKGAEEVDHLRDQIKKEVERYVTFMRKNGYYAEGLSYLGIDVIAEIEKISEDVLTRFPGAVFFGGQLVFPEDTFWTRWLHNYTVFALQRKFYQKGIPFVLLPIRV